MARIAPGKEEESAHFHGTFVISFGIYAVPASMQGLGPPADHVGTKHSETL